MKNISIIIDYTFFTKVIGSDKELTISATKLLDYVVKNIKHRTGNDKLNVSAIETFRGINLEQSYLDTLVSKELRKTALHFCSSYIPREYQVKTLADGKKREAGVDSSIYISVEDALYNSQKCKAELHNSTTAILADRGLVDYIILVAGDGDYAHLLDRVPSNVGFGLLALDTPIAKTNKLLYSKFGENFTQWRTIIEPPPYEKHYIAFNVLPIKSTISAVRIGPRNNKGEIDHTKTVVYVNTPNDIRLRENAEKSGLMIPFLKTKLPLGELYEGRKCIYDVNYISLTKDEIINYDFVANKLQLL